MSQQDDRTARDDEAVYFADLAAQVGSEDFDLGPAATAVAGTGDAPGREYLAPYLSSGEMEAAVRRGRPRLSSVGTRATGTGRSPKRQVRLPEDVDQALVRVAQEQGRTPSAVMRQAIETYLRTA